MPVEQRLVTGWIPTTNFDETCYQDHIRYGEFENDGPNERWRRGGTVPSPIVSTNPNLGSAMGLYIQFNQLLEKMH